MAKKVRDIEAEIDVVQTPEQASLTLDRIASVKRPKVRSRLTNQLNEKFDNTVAPYVEKNKKTIETNLDNIDKKNTNGSVLASAVEKTNLNNVDAQVVDEELGADGMVRKEDGSLVAPSQVVLEKTGDVETATNTKIAIDAVQKLKKYAEEEVEKTGIVLGGAVSNNENIGSTGYIAPVDNTPVNGDGTAVTTAIDKTGGFNTPATMNTYGTANDVPLNSGISTLTPEQIVAYRQAQQQYNALKNKNSYEPAIEALNVQQYFPQSDRDIRVGGYQGKNIGSISTYVARGGTLPYGLVDARRRAIRDEVKAKAALAAKIEDLNYNTSQQFNDQYIKYGQDNLEGFMKAANYDTEYLNGNNELGMKFRRWKKEYENAGKDVIYIDGIVDKIEEDLKTNRFVDSETLKLVYEWKNGKQNLDEMFEGKQNIKAFADKFKSYENVSTYIASSIERFTKTPDQMPINMKAGVLDKPENAKLIGEAIIKKEGQSYDQFISGVKEFYDISRLEAFVEQSFEHNNFFEGYSEDQRIKEINKAKAELIAQLGQKVTIKNDFQANKKLEYARLSFDKWKDAEDRKTMYDNVDQMTSKDLKGLLDEEYRKIEAMNISVAEKIKLKEKAHFDIASLNKNYSQDLTNITGYVTSRIPLSDTELRKTMSAEYGNMAVTVTKGGKKINYSLGEYSKKPVELRKKWCENNGVDFTDIELVIKRGTVDYRAKDRGVSLTTVTPDGKIIGYNHTTSKPRTTINDVAEIVIATDPVEDSEGNQVYIDGVPQFKPTRFSKNNYLVSYNGGDGSVITNLNSNHGQAVKGSGLTTKAD